MYVHTHTCMNVCLCGCDKCVLDRCIAMLGRSFVRLSIASLAFQIKTKLNTSWAELLLLLLLFLLFCQRVRDYCCCCCRLICLLQKAIVTRAFDRLLFTPPHTVRVPYTINTLTLTYTIYLCPCMCLCVWCSACFLSPCNILICSVFILDYSNNNNSPGLLRSSRARLGCSLSLSVSRTAVLSFNDLTVRYSVCSSQFTISNCFISQKHKKAHRQKAKKPKKSS